MFEQLRLIVRNCEFRPSPGKSEARKEFFRRLHREKTQNRGRLSLVTFLWRSKESNSPTAKLLATKAAPSSLTAGNISNNEKMQPSRRSAASCPRLPKLSN
jgi:hypothetical protein